VIFSRRRRARAGLGDKSLGGESVGGDGLRIGRRTGLRALDLGLGDQAHDASLISIMLDVKLRAELIRVID